MIALAAHRSARWGDAARRSLDHRHGHRSGAAGQGQVVAGDFTVGGLPALAEAGKTIANWILRGQETEPLAGPLIDLVAASGEVRRYLVVGLVDRAGLDAQGEALTVMKPRRRTADAADVDDIRIRLDLIRKARAATEPRRSWATRRCRQEANEFDDLEVLDDPRLSCTCGLAAIPLVAGFGIFNIVSTMTTKKVNRHRTPRSGEADMRRLFLVEGLAIGVGGWISAGGRLRASARPLRRYAERFEIQRTEWARLRMRLHPGASGITPSLVASLCSPRADPRTW